MRRFLCTLLLFSAHALAAQSAFLNSAFDDDGIASPDVGTTSSALDAMLGDDGSVLLAGEIDNVGGLIKLLPNGSLDTSFGTGGSVEFTFGNRTGYVADVDRLDGGDLLVAGSASNTAQTDIGFGFVGRVSSAGTLQSSFGTDGIVRINEGAGYSRPAVVDAEVLDDGRILVAASARDPELDQIIVLVRLQADGSFDTTFGTDGVAIVDALILIEDAALLSDGRLVLSGYLPTSTDGTQADAALAAITTSGTLDTSFGTGGVARLSLGGDFDRFREIDIDSNGRIVVAGTSSNGTTEAAVARYTASGALDSAFGTSGVARVTGTNTRGADVSVLDDDRIVLVGTENAQSVLVARLTDAGVPDATFNADGKASFALSSNVFGVAGAIYDDGDILAAGYTYVGDNRDQSSAVALRVTTGPVDNENTPEALAGLRLGVEGAYPARRVRIALSLDEAAPVRLDLYDVRGRHTAMLFDGALPSGEHTFTGPDRLAPGTYIVRARAANGAVVSLPVVVLR